MILGEAQHSLSASTQIKSSVQSIELLSQKTTKKFFLLFCLACIGTFTTKLKM